MKITFEGVTRVLDLEHVKLRHGVAIQEFTGVTLIDWQRALFSRDMETLKGMSDPEQAEGKITALTDPGWIVNMAAAHWLMLAQNDEDPPPLDDDFDPDVLGFVAAFMAAGVEELKARKVPDKPDPTARPGRRAPSSRQTAPRKPKTTPGEVVRPLPLTGS